MASFVGGEKKMWFALMVFEWFLCVCFFHQRGLVLRMMSKSMSLLKSLKSTAAEL